MLPPNIFIDFTTESILTGIFPVYNGYSTKHDHKALKRVVQSAEYITNGALSVQAVYRQQKKNGQPFQPLKLQSVLLAVVRQVLL